MHKTIPKNGVSRSSRLVAAAVLCAVGLLTGSCRRGAPSDGQYSADLVRRYLGLAVALGDRDPDSIDFYVSTDPAGVPVRSNPPGLGALHARAIQLRADLLSKSASPVLDVSRRQFLLDQVAALLFRIEQLSGEARPFDEESHILFGVTAPQDTHAADRAATRRQVAELLGGSGKLAAAYSRYDAHFIVPAQRVPAVLEAALQSCRAVTVQHVTLPQNERVRIEYVSQKPWSAFSRYMGDSQSLLQINMDYPLTVDRILNLACHEGYPGHHVFNLLRDKKLVREMHREEFDVQPTFSPQSYLSEAAASYAPLLLSDDERLRIERDTLFPLAGLKPADVYRDIKVQKLIASLHTADPSIARDYLDGNLEFVRAADALERETLMEHSETTLFYLNEFRTYMLTYTLGADQIKAFVEGGGAGSQEKWQRYLSLVTMQELRL